MSESEAELPPEPAATESALTDANEAHQETHQSEDIPMLDVHDAHHAASTWKDFFIHIATIVLGLLIAISLEQTVEYFHHRHQAEHTREMLAAEMAFNDRIQQRARHFLAMHEDYLFQDLAVLDRLRHHTLQPTDRMVLYHPPTNFSDAAWQTAQQSGAVALFPYAETQRYARLYGIQAEFEATMTESMTALQNTNTMFYAGAADRFDYARATRVAGGNAFAGELGEAHAHLAFEDQAHTPEQLQRLRPEQVDRLEQTIQQAIYEDEKLIDRCIWLTQGYHQFIQ